MSKTVEMIQKTLSEIENTSVKMDSKPKTAEEVKNILLNISDSGERKATVTQANTAKLQTEEKINNEFCFDMDSLKRYKEECNRQFVVPYFRGIMPSWKRFNGPVIFMKKIIRKLCRSLIEPMVELQNNFNASATNTLNALYNNEVVTESFIAQQHAVNNQVIVLQKQQEEMKNEIARLTAEVSSMVAQLNLAKATIEKNAEAIAESVAKAAETSAEVIYNNPLTAYEDIDYFDFETNFRGSQYSVKEKLKEYVPFFAKKGTVVELGCGRGEFLELLSENDIDAIGVDTYEEFVEYCREKGLCVVHEDATEYMKSLEAKSIAGVFAAQVVEHLSTGALVELCRLSYEKLVPGGVLIFETPNPTNLSMYLNGYYMDPTHHNPVHPRTLEYLLKKAGFKEVDIIYTEQSKTNYRFPLLNATGVENLSEFNNGINLLSDAFFGSQDYAVIARK